MTQLRGIGKRATVWASVVQNPFLFDARVSFSHVWHDCGDVRGLCTEMLHGDSCYEGCRTLELPPVEMITIFPLRHKLLMALCCHCCYRQSSSCWRIKTRPFSECICSYGATDRYNRYEPALTAERIVWRCLWCWNSCQKVTGCFTSILSVLFCSALYKRGNWIPCKSKKERGKISRTRKYWSPEKLVSVACEQEARGGGQRWRCGSCSALLLEGTVRSGCLFQNEEGININTARAIQVIRMWTAQSIPSL